MMCIQPQPHRKLKSVHPNYLLFHFTSFSFSMYCTYEAFLLKDRLKECDLLCLRFYELFTLLQLMGLCDTALGTNGADDVRC